jgi:F-type H+-transporting ATPase subunit epsilon
MAEGLMLEVVTPERELVRESVAEVQLPGISGYLGILPGHTPLLTELGIGPLIYKKGSESGYIAVIGGFAEVLPERVTVLAEAAERSEEIDAARARADLAEAEKKLAASGADPNTDWDAALKAVASARARLDAAAHGAQSPGTER